MMTAVLLPDLIYQHIRYIELLLVFGGLVAGWFFLKRFPDRVRTLRAASWEIADGRIETVKVTAFGDQALAEVGYSYSVEGDRYSGYFTRQFGDEQHAWSYVDGLREQQVVVRYKREAPASSALRSVDQQSYVDLKGRSFLGSFLGGMFDRFRNSLYPRRL